MKKNGLDITQYVFFCVPQKREIHKGLEQHKGKNMITEFSFLRELAYSFKQNQYLRKEKLKTWT